MTAHVDIQWFWLTLHPDETWKSVEAKLIESEADLNKISKSVYVIRAADSFAIKYPRKYSPVLYIGEGGFKQRITSHRKWLAAIYEIAGEFPLEVAICFPRVRNNTIAHREFEAHLLSKFLKQYGSLPLRNKINENAQYNHTYQRQATSEVLGPGKGKKYKWALEPLKANPFYKDYVKTHA
ncbi:MAG: hypothetical protein LCH72_13045 [Proteobacteria bacterium]|nr:hypothetical protein [Pseudomonadota bacterium]